jgi:DNA-binding response OmpR family regulator
MDKLLIIDDDKEFCELLKDFLTPEGFATDFSNTAEEGLAKIKTGDHSIVLLDVMLPNISGFQVLDSIHKMSNIPIIMLTARNDITDKIVGLEMGADEYIFKPFNPRELIARIRSVLRRTRHQTEDGPDQSLPPPLKVGDVELDSAALRVTCGGSIVKLTSVEFSILELLMKNAGKVVQKDWLVKATLGRPLTHFDRSMDVHISSIRKKLGKMEIGRAHV